jgi:hypothetical protein
MQRFESCRPSQPARLQCVTYEGRSKTARYRVARNCANRKSAVPASGSSPVNRSPGHEGYLVPFTLVMTARTSDHDRDRAEATASMTARGSLISRRICSFQLSSPVTIRPPRLDRVKENLGAAEVSRSDEPLSRRALAGIEVTGDRLSPALLEVTDR